MLSKKVSEAQTNVYDSAIKKSNKKRKIPFSKPPIYLLKACNFHYMLPEQHWLCYVTVRICKQFFSLIKLSLSFVLCNIPHTCTYKFICKYTQFCGDTCLHMYHENKHFMKVNWYINNSDTVSFSSRRQSDSAMERQSRRRKWGRGSGGMQWMGMVSHKIHLFLKSDPS